MPLYFVANKARKHVKVVLSGEGADEFFGGYTIYREPLSLARVRRPARPAAARPARGVDGLPEGVRGKDFLRRGTTPIEERYYGNARHLHRGGQAAPAAPLRPDRSLHRRHRAALRRDATRLDDVTKMQYVDLFTWLRGDILVKADRMSMAHSLELRVPFLDPEVFEVGRHAPGRPASSPRQTTKYALRRALEQIVPAARAQPAEARLPGADPALAGRGRCTTGRAQIIAESQTDEWLDKAAVLAMLDAHRATSAAARVDYSRKLWTLLVFMIWHGIFVEERITPAIPEPVYPVRL